MLSLCHITKLTVLHKLKGKETEELRGRKETHPNSVSTNGCMVETCQSTVAPIGLAVQNTSVFYSSSVRSGHQTRERDNFHSRDRGQKGRS